MDSDRELLLGVLAVEAGHIDQSKLNAAIAAWRRSETGSLVELLLERGWITPAIRVALDKRVEQFVSSHGGTVREALSSAAARTSKDLAFELDEGSDRHTAPFAATPERHTQLGTVDWKPDARSRYTLTRVHGKGGLGQVWLAIDGHLNRPVALKEVLPGKDADPHVVRRLIKEAQITGQLEHPNIVPVYELTRNEQDSRPFYTMRFLRGHTLAKRIGDYHDRRRKGQAGPLELHQLLGAFVGICHALAYAHARGVIHRDLKPENVMLGDFGEVIVLDWGLAKQVGEPDESSDLRGVQVSNEVEIEATREGRIIGSPAYMSPEQADGQIGLMDARTDIYGLGAILFTILTGEPPHRGKRHGGSAQDTADLLRRISEQPTPDARSIDRAVPAALSAICARAMARKRAERYPQALALAEDVQRWLADEPVSVYRETRRERLARWVRRHRTWAAAAAVALTLISIVSLVAAGFVNRARQDTQRALESEQQARAQTQQALDAEQKALAAERAAKAEAMRRFLEARETVDKSLTGVSNVLRYYPGVEPLRIELLKKAAEDYERFAREQSDDPQLQAESGRALIRLGDVRQLLGETELARRAYAAAQAAFDKLAQGQPASREFELELATVHGRLAVLATATAAHDEAARSFDAAARLLDKLGRGSGGEARVRHLRAEVLVNQATLLAQTGRRTGAQKLLDEAEADLADLAGVAGDRRALEGLARTRSESGQLLGGLGRTAEGVAKLKQALATYQRLASIDPNHPPYLEGLCEARVALGNALAALGRDREILQAYEAARADYRDLLKVRPGVPFYRESLALVDTNLALMLHRLERNPTAKQHAMDGLSECVELVNAHPQVVRYHAQHATATLTLGLILRELDETMLAETALDDAVRRCVELTDQVRDVPEHRRRLASSVMARGRLFASTGRGAAAIAEFRRALADLDKAAKAGLDDPATADARAWCHQYLADALLAAGNAMEAATHYAQCRTLQERLTADVDDSGARRPADPEQLMNFAIFLANCASPQFRDPAGADRLARAATARVADNGRYQTALGLAAYRAGHIDDAITAARHAIELRDGGCSSDWFTLAMAQEKKGEKQEARKSFDRGIEIMKANCPGSVEAGRLRREAAGLLAVPDAPQ